MLPLPFIMIRRPDTLYYRILNGTGPLLFRSRSKAIAAVLGGSVCLGASLIIPHTVAQDWTLADQQIHRCVSDVHFILNFYWKLC